MSRFFCDTNCELWFDKAEALGITVIKMPYTVGEEMSFYDLGKNTDIKSFFDKMREGANAKTQALNSSEYFEYFEPVLAGGEDVLYVTFSHEMSGTFNAMRMAIDELSEKYPDRKITVVDTCSISMGAGRTVEEAAKLHNSGASDEEVVEFVNSFKDRARIFFTVADLKYLVRGGRISAFSGTIGNLLDLKPIITVKNGKLESIAKIKGRKKSLFTLADKLGLHNVDLAYPVTIINADCSADSEFLVSLIKSKYPDAVIGTQLVGPVVGAHCGPDTMGVVFVEKA